jgi:hypothetical protein
VTTKLRGWEALILWALLAEGGKSYWSALIKKKMISKDHAADREALARARLITSENRPGKGKGIWMEVTDEGWRRAGENLDVALPSTQTASAVLQAWLTCLQAFMTARNFALADVLDPQIFPPNPTPPPLPSTFDYATMRERVRNAYLELTGGRFNTRALLRDIREKLNDIERGELDDVLKQMQREQLASLYQLDNRTEITDADRAAAIYFGSEPRHILWMER